MPQARQRLTFRASHAPAGAWWQLDDRRLETADWPLAHGRHRLGLNAPDGRVLDQVQFEVR
jgi:hypothetical protein